MKKTKKRTDKKGHLPPLAPRRPRDQHWGTAKETFHTRFCLPDHLNRPNHPDYRCKYVHLVYIITVTVFMKSSMYMIDMIDIRDNVLHCNVFVVVCMTQSTLDIIYCIVMYLFQGLLWITQYTVLSIRPQLGVEDRDQPLRPFGKCVTS